MDSLRISVPIVLVVFLCTLYFVVPKEVHANNPSPSADISDQHPTQEWPDYASTENKEEPNLPTPDDEEELEIEPQYDQVYLDEF